MFMLIIIKSPLYTDTVYSTLDPHTHVDHDHQRVGMQVCSMLKRLVLRMTLTLAIAALFAM